METKKIWSPGDPVISGAPTAQKADPQVLLKHMTIVIESLFEFLKILMGGFGTYFTERKKFGNNEITGDEEVVALNELVATINRIHKEVNQVFTKADSPKEAKDEPPTGTTAV